MKIDFKKDYILDNEYVLLRPLVNSDFEHLVEYSITEPEIWMYNSKGANGKENLKNYIESTINMRAAEKEYPFIVFDKTLNKYVGCTRFYLFNAFNNTADLGYTWYGKESQGTKVNKSCKFLMLQFAFETIEIDRVGFGANNINEKSIRAMKSIGCTEEGVLRNFSLDNSGNRIDVIVLSILKNEWEGRVKSQLEAKLKKG